VIKFPAVPVRTDKPELCYGGQTGVENQAGGEAVDQNGDSVLKVEGDGSYIYILYIYSLIFMNCFPIVF